MIKISLFSMYRCLIFLTLLFNQINCDCIYPEWKQTCQKYCMDNQLYEIQLNQCYSMDPKQVTCKCNGKNLTETIKKLINKEDPSSSSIVTSSTILMTIHSNGTCIPSYSCTTGRKICNGLNAYCTCNNGTWISIPCSTGNICKTEGSISSCQTIVPVDGRTSLFSVSGLGSSIGINGCFHVFLFCLLILKNNI